MVLATAAADTAIVLGAIGLFLASVTASVVQLSGLRKIRSVVEDTHEQVTTINSKTLAQLSDASETRRIEALDPDDRTAEDEAHIAEVPDAERPASIADRVAHVEEVGVATHDRVESINRAVNAVPADQPSLYELVQALDTKLDAYTKRTGARFDRLEQSIGLPGDEPDDAVSNAG